MRLNSLAFRLIAGAAIWSAAGLLAGGLVLSAVFRDNAETAFDARLALLLESLVAATETGSDGSLRLARTLGEARFEQTFSGWYWQIVGPGAVTLRSASLFDEALPMPAAPDGGAVLYYGGEGPVRQRLRLAAREIFFPGLDEGVGFIVAADRREIDAQIRRFNTVLAWAFGLLALGLIVAMILQVRIGLQPLRRVRRDLAYIRSGRRERLDANYPAEIAPLAGELNGLLEQNARIVERARNHVGNLAHVLKTPLSVLANEARADHSDQGLAALVRRQTEHMRRQVDHYLARARTAATGTALGARTSVSEVAADLRRALGRIHAERGIRIELDCPPELAFRGERQDLEEMIGNLLDNACKWAATKASLRVRRVGENVRLIFEDDGPGLDEAQYERVLARGARLDENVPGTGLGLAIVGDIAGLYGGGLRLGRAEAGGLLAELTLPAAEAAAK
ncbi:MAG: ATP-binding protein [Alphaproteobacteria bacterium]